MFLLCLAITLSYPELFSAEKLRRYARILKLDALTTNETGNDLWHGLFRDCHKRVTFSCIQKNAYTYLDNAFIERDNITVFDGLVLTKSNVTYDTCRPAEGGNDVRENLVDDADADNCEKKAAKQAGTQGRKFAGVPESPLEEITNALRRKAVRFLSTRNYELQLPQFFFQGATVKISPREIDESGALLRVDFGNREVEEGRILFKKISERNYSLTFFMSFPSGIFCRVENDKNGNVNIWLCCRKIHTKQTADQFPGASPDYQADQGEVSVRHSVPLRSGRGEETLLETATLLHSRIRAHLQALLQLLFESRHQIPPSSSSGMRGKHSPLNLSHFIYISVTHLSKTSHFR